MRDRYGIHQCTTHSTVDCQECFNWPEIIVEVSKSKDWEGKVHSRKDLLGLLKSMGVELPANTKLVDDLLDQKLGNALTAAQKLSPLVPDPSHIDPSKLPLWKTTPAFQAMSRTSPNEAMKRFNSPNSDPFPLYTNTWMDARQTTMHVARNFENGVAVMALKDDYEAIAIRVLSIHKLNENTPLIALIYYSSDLATPAVNSFEWMGAQMQTGRLAQIKCTSQEQALLRKLLFQNSRRVSTEFKPKMAGYERRFKPSFLVPLNPLDQLEIGKLSHNTGCQVCGGKTTSRCAQCQSASYCSRTCQSDDWKQHKALCKSLKGGSWASTDFTKHVIVNGKKMYISVFSASGTVPPSAQTAAQAAAERDDDSPPPNVHGDRPFIVKVSNPFPAGNPTQGLLVYDRQRTFKAYVMQEDRPQVYGAAMQLIIARNNRMKVYRWAKRTGDFKLDVCLDRIPDPEPTW
ncbi:hypothetical protein BDZ89DRAFT_959052 [Hymenopellis radicata]|nr:hypothetical protein BDZ89DRAFT_959052 [Hymenopellis radicata]